MKCYCMEGQPAQPGPLPPPAGRRLDGRHEGTWWALRLSQLVWPTQCLS